MFGNLQRAFQDYGRRGAFGQIDIIHFSAWLSHYVSDAIQPFHGVINYDGQLTKQNGIHARFESALVERYRDRAGADAEGAAADSRAARLHLRPADRGHAARAGHPQSRPRRARRRATPTTTRTSTAFFRATRPVLERRLSESIAAVAAIITGAWEAAGRPPVPVSPAPPAPCAAPRASLTAVAPSGTPCSSSWCRLADNATSCTASAITPDRTLRRRAAAGSPACAQKFSTMLRAAEEGEEVAAPIRRDLSRGCRRG